ncbi:DUF4271 domain-containing protein [Flavobacterium sp.]|jgi:hypothetical protein|uniref:DUF4271 domain-containing protein n=1 Tax=Flavobacterium sp. TaxID=239 RepID=UPI0037BE94C6
MEHFLEYRIEENKDWATILFLLCLLLVAITKGNFENRFSDFMRLIVNDKYLKIYKDSSNVTSRFTISLFIVQLISFSFFILIILSYFGIAEKTDFIKYIQIITLIGVFVLSKYLIDKIIATTFSIEEFAEQLNLQKVSYRAFIGLFIIPVNVILYYNDYSSKIIAYTFMSIVLIINTFTYLKTLKSYQNILINKLFYFILYLCALEIAPYYFMYYWFTKS